MRKPTSARAKGDQPRRVVVIGGSAGGIEALCRLAAELPSDFPAPLVVVIHRSIGPGGLPAIVERAGPLPARYVIDGEPLKAGHIALAPPDAHVVIAGDRLRLDRGPRENNCRPAVDVLFRTAARACGPRVIGVVLSGMLDDGTSGMLAIKQAGGVVIVQDPVEALMPAMPLSVLQHMKVDHSVGIHEMAALLTRLASKSAVRRRAVVAKDDEPLRPALLVCPECLGPLWEIDEGSMLRYRCRLGHRFTADFLIEGKENALETALWIALNALEEKAELCRRLAVRARASGQTLTARRWEADTSEQSERAEYLRRLLLGSGTAVAPRSRSKAAKRVKEPSVRRKK